MSESFYNFAPSFKIENCHTNLAFTEQENKHSTLIIIA